MRDGKWDHPHACGDKGKDRQKNRAKTGSSPRVWGQAQIVIVYDYSVRIIPTRVGTRCKSDSVFEAIWDHPHACGDKWACANCGTFKAGSSPRVWGQAIGYLRTSKNQGIIPTRVGTRGSSFPSTSSPTDHPHACGDKAETHLYRSKDRGSSPRVWGQVLNSAWNKIFEEDHPHACGDKLSIK